MPFQYYPVHDLYEQKNPIPFSFTAIVMKGLGHESDPNEWLNYRRNHIQIDIDIQLKTAGGPLYLKSCHEHHVKKEETVNLCGTEKSMTNMVSTGSKCLDTHQISKLLVHCNAFSSYDQKVSAVKTDKLQPVRITQSTATRVISDTKIFEPIPVIDFTKSTAYQKVTLDRIQFSRATLGNYLSFNQLETFTIELELYAETSQGELILIGYALSMPCISRGRAPCHFERLCPEHADPTKRRTSGKVSKKQQRNFPHISSPIQRVLTPPQDMSQLLPPLYIPIDGYEYFEPPLYVSPSEIFSPHHQSDDAQSTDVAEMEFEFVNYNLDYPSPPPGSMDSSISERS
jgi:hypothetical protein